MYQRETLGMDDARTIVEAVLNEALKEPIRPIAVAVVDHHGDLVYAARMDGSGPLFPHMAINKAYTSSRLGMDTAQMAERQKEFQRELATWGDNKLSDIRGGVVIIKPGKNYFPGQEKRGTVLGGIGVSGRLASEDEELARVGLNALNL